MASRCESSKSSQDSGRRWKDRFHGGFNIKREYWNSESEAPAFRDLHFRLSGPVVAHLSEVFADDWQFTTREALRGEKWFPTLPLCGGMLARGVEAGPDESFERLRWVIIGALNAARRSVRVITPYFLPDAGIVSALNAAALRGVEVDILLPEHSNLGHVHWATFGQIWQVLERGCRVWLSSGQFDHSKLMIVE
jgi:cardiolipin synthase